MVYDGDPREFMWYKGDIYINGTQMKLNQEYIKNRWPGKKIWPYAVFIQKCGNEYLFQRCKCDHCDLFRMGYKTPESRTKVLKEYEAWFMVSIYEVDFIIDDFIRPIKMSKEEQENRLKAIEYMVDHPNRDLEYPQMILLWVVYIFAMIGSLIFNEFYILWAVITFVFIKLRKDILGG